MSSEMCKLENGKACVILCLRRYNERKIVMDKKFLRHISSMMLLVCTLAAVSPVTAFAGWQKEGDTYAYYLRGRRVHYGTSGRINHGILCERSRSTGIPSAFGWIACSCEQCAC